MSLRADRVGESLREILAEGLAGFTDPRLRYATITAVEVSGDLSTALVYYSILGSAEELVAAGTAFKRARKRLQTYVAEHTTMKRTPKLAFRPDDGILRGERIDTLLRKMEVVETASPEVVETASPLVELLGTDGDPAL